MMKKYTLIAVLAIAGLGSNLSGMEQKQGWWARFLNRVGVMPLPKPSEYDKIIYRMSPETKAALINPYKTDEYKKEYKEYLDARRPLISLINKYDRIYRRNTDEWLNRKRYPEIAENRKYLDRLIRDNDRLKAPRWRSAQSNYKK